MRSAKSSRGSFWVPQCGKAAKRSLLSCGLHSIHIFRQNLSAGAIMGNEHILITGAAGAIGAALAHELRRRRQGAHLSLVDRDGAALDRLASALPGSVSTDLLDLGCTHSLAEHWSLWTTAAGPVTTLINCAGIMLVRSLAGTTWQRARELLDIDLIAPLRLMDLALPEMLATGHGCIVNITSMAGITPLRGCSYYGAAKAGLAMASEIANQELRKRGVHVLTVYPGPIASALERGARAGYGSSWTRHLPSSKPQALAMRIVDGIDSRATRLVYPK
ncbi:MAG TPA: SDR family NAD(P)-dependent oxidoreductase, partial [Nannocystis exedens]|nr:SDR family NAD(P)-dependent oxidoreductase [Nannocystis exedens]